MGKSSDLPVIQYLVKKVQWIDYIRCCRCFKDLFCISFDVKIENVFVRLFLDRQKREVEFERRNEERSKEDFLDILYYLLCCVDGGRDYFVSLYGARY